MKSVFSVLAVAAFLFLSGCATTPPANDTSGAGTGEPAATSQDSQASQADTQKKERKDCERIYRTGSSIPEVICR